MMFRWSGEVQIIWVKSQEYSELDIALVDLKLVQCSAKRRKYSKHQKCISFNLLNYI